ncbi:hypothetical protein HDV06_000005 [Boothiomyces sp. JEL0866]|nr:hypothetical protein HDV06_000005 [Boothiomyces sp. JEL0866]
MTSLVYQSGWFNSLDCSGPPSTMYIFNEDAAPPVYNNLQSDTPIPICGCSTPIVPTGCCISSLNMNFTYNYQSITRNYIDDLTRATPPKSANSYAYCTITAATNDSLAGIYQIYYLANNQCQENVICNINSNTIRVFNETGCTGYHEIYYTASNQIESSSILGNITVGLQLIKNADLTILWVANSPSNNLVPQFKVPVERFAAFCYAASLLLVTLTGMHYLIRYYKFRLLRDLLFAITQGLLSLNIILQCVYYSVVMTNTQLSELDLGVQVFGVYSLFSVYVSLFIIFTIYREYQSTIYEKLAYIGFTVFYLGTMNYYLIADIHGIITGVQDDFYYLMLELQYNADMYWKFAYVIMEMLPSVLILNKLIFGASAKKLQKLQKSINLVLALSGLQLINIITYEVFNLIGTYTLYYGSDRTVLASTSINYFMQALNSLIVLIVYEKLVDLLEKISNRKLIAARNPPSSSVTNVPK